MARILVTGSTDGVGRATADALLADGHAVVVHARNRARLAAVQDLLDRGAEVIVGDLADLDEIRDLVQQANALGRFDALIHNAGTMHGAVLPVNVTGPYLMTAGIRGPDRLIYLSSSMHRAGHADLAGVDWTGQRQARSYADAKLFVTVLMAAIARRWPHVAANAVDPGWVPTRMGGPDADDDLALAHVTQTWLATTDDPEALVGGRLWFHHEVQPLHAAVHDEAFQEALLASLAEQAGVTIDRDRGE